ncbi:SagF family protein, partial [Streptococcus pyogenes]
MTLLVLILIFDVLLQPSLLFLFPPLPFLPFLPSPPFFLLLFLFLFLLFSLLFSFFFLLFFFSPSLPLFS